MLRQFGRLKILAGLLAAFALTLAACTPPEGGEAVVHTLTVNVEGDGAGTVVSVPAGIDTSDTDTADFTEDTTVTLTATAAAGSTFTGWSGACTGAAATCEVTMNQAQTVTATFTADEEPTGPFTLSVDVTGDGSVTSEPAGIDCPGDCEEQFEQDTVVTLTANEGTDSFVGWGGACTGAAATCEVTMSGATNVTATFATQGDEVARSYQIASETDDAEEFLDDVSASFPPGSVQTLSSDLDLNYDIRSGNDSRTIVGLRYTNVDIPQDATIVSASITFTPAAAGAGTVTYTIEGQLSANADTFAYGGTGNEANFDISSRPTTTASTTWDSTTTWTDPTVESAGIAAVIQEIVGQEAWTSGNALAIIISSDNSDATNYRVAEAFPNDAPVLNVVYTAPVE